MLISCILAALFWQCKGSKDNHRHTHTQVPVPLPLPGLGGGVLPQGGVVGVAAGRQGPWGVVVLRAALAGAGRAVVQGVRAVGVACPWGQEEVGAAQRSHSVCVCVRVGGQQLPLGLQAGAPVPKVLSQIV